MLEGCLVFPSLCTSRDPLLVPLSYPDGLLKGPIFRATHGPLDRIRHGHPGPTKLRMQRKTNRTALNRGLADGSRIYQYTDNRALRHSTVWNGDDHEKRRTGVDFVTYGDTL